MDKISINDLPRIKKELVGYKLTFNLLNGEFN